MPISLHYMKKFITRLGFVSSLLFSTSVFAANLDSIVAVVNDQVITQSDLNHEIDGLTAQQNSDPNAKKMSSQQLRKAAFDNIVDRNLQLQAAKTMGITVSDSDLNDALTNIAQQHNLTLAQLPDAVAKDGVNYDKFKSQIKEQLIIQKLQQQQLTDTVHISQKEVDKMAQKLAANPQTDQDKTVQQAYHFQELVIPMPAQPTQADVAQAKQVFDTVAGALTKGESFETINSTILGKTTPVGDLGWRTVNQLPPQFVPIAAKMKIGDIAPPVRSEDGIHILKLVETKQVSPSTNNDTANIITETHVRHILLKKDPLTPDSVLERRLVNLRNDIMHGLDFAKAANENSQDPGSVANGGDLGWIKPGILDPKFENAMNKLQVNEISQPVKTQFGWHLIQVLERKKITDPKAALQLKAQQILFQQKMQEASKQMISQLKAQAAIKINDQTLADK